MNHTKLNKNHFSLDADGVITFFGAKGRKWNGRWLINALGGDLWWKVAPDSMMPEIRQCIEQDIAAGNGDKIAQVLLAPRAAVVLFLEDKLTAEHLKKATEQKGMDFIDIQGVELDNRTVTVRVIAKPTHMVATADINGEVL